MNGSQSRQKSTKPFQRSIINEHPYYVHSMNIDEENQHSCFYSDIYAECVLLDGAAAAVVVVWCLPAKKSKLKCTCAIRSLCILFHHNNISQWFLTHSLSLSRAGCLCLSSLNLSFGLRFCPFFRFHYILHQTIIVITTFIHIVRFEMKTDIDKYKIQNEKTVCVSVCECVCAYIACKPTYQTLFALGFFLQSRIFCVLFSSIFCCCCCLLLPRRRSRRSKSKRLHRTRIMITMYTQRTCPIEHWIRLYWMCNHWGNNKKK